MARGRKFKSDPVHYETDMYVDRGVRGASGPRSESGMGGNNLKKPQPGQTVFRGGKWFDVLDDGSLVEHGATIGKRS